MNFESIISQIERNKAIKDAGGITSIAPPFPRLAQYYGGFTKGSITCITAASGVGKSKFAKYMTIVNIYKATRNTEITPKIFYFALEESSTDFWLSFISIYLHQNHNLTITVQQLKSIGNFRVSSELMTKIKAAETFITNLQNIVEVVDYIRNPTGIAKYVKLYFDNPEVGENIYKDLDDGRRITTGYRYKSEDHWVFFVLDHISSSTNPCFRKANLHLQGTVNGGETRTFYGRTPHQ